MKIRVINEKDWEKSYELDKSIIRIGSQYTCDVLINDNEVAPLMMQITRSGTIDVRNTMRFFSENVMLTRGDQTFPPEMNVPYEVLDGDKITFSRYRMIIEVDSDRSRVRQSEHMRAEMFLSDRDLAPDSPISGGLLLKNLGTQRPCQFRMNIKGIPEDCLYSSPLPFLHPGATSSVGFTISHLKTKPSPGFHTVSITLNAPDDYYGEMLEFNQDIYVHPVFENEMILEDDSDKLTNGTVKAAEKKENPLPEPVQVMADMNVRDSGMMNLDESVYSSARAPQPSVRVLSSEEQGAAFTDNEDDDDIPGYRRRKERVVVIHNDDSLFEGETEEAVRGEDENRQPEENAGADVPENPDKGMSEPSAAQKGTEDPAPKFESGDASSVNNSKPSRKSKREKKPEPEEAAPLQEPQAEPEPEIHQEEPQPDPAAEIKPPKFNPGVVIVHSSQRDAFDDEVPEDEPALPYSGTKPAFAEETEAEPVQADADISDNKVTEPAEKMSDMPVQEPSETLSEDPFLSPDGHMLTADELTEENSSGKEKSSRDTEPADELNAVPAEEASPEEGEAAPAKKPRKKKTVNSKETAAPQTESADFPHPEDHDILMLGDPAKVYETEGSDVDIRTVFERPDLNGQETETAPAEEPVLTETAEGETEENKAEEVPGAAEVSPEEVPTEEPAAEAETEPAEEPVLTETAEEKTEENPTEEVSEPAEGSPEEVPADEPAAESQQEPAEEPLLTETAEENTEENPAEEAPEAADMSPEEVPAEEPAPETDPTPAEEPVLTETAEENTEENPAEEVPEAADMSPEEVPADEPAAETEQEPAEEPLLTETAEEKEKENLTEEVSEPAEGSPEEVPAEEPAVETEQEPAEEPVLTETAEENPAAEVPEAVEVSPEEVPTEDTAPETEPSPVEEASPEEDQAAPAKKPRKKKSEKNPAAEVPEVAEVSPAEVPAEEPAPETEQEPAEEPMLMKNVKEETEEKPAEVSPAEEPAPETKPAPKKFKPTVPVYHHSSDFDAFSDDFADSSYDTNEDASETDGDGPVIRVVKGGSFD